MKTRWIPLILLFVFVVNAGCQSNVLNSEAPPQAISSPVQTPFSTHTPDTANQDIATPDRLENTMTKSPERVPPTEAFPPVTGEVPTELLDSILKDLSERTGVTTARITLIQAQEIVWNDGSLGCAKPGEFYTQALVNGYWMILEVDGQKYDYRAADNGYFFLCENSLPPISSPATPSS